MQGTDATLASFFVATIFGVTEGSVYVSSLPNTEADRDAGEPGEKHVMTRDGATVTRFVERWDRARRGLFFCVSTLRDGAVRRSKEDVAETVLLHADIDFKSVEGDETSILHAIEVLPCRPSIVIRSGNGLHLYWLLKEAIELDPFGIERVELALGQIADVVGGDPAVAEVSRLMRLPGTHNTKGSASIPVEKARSDYGLRHNLEDIEDMLSYMSPLVHRRLAPNARAPQPTNPYLAAAARIGFKPPVDVQARLEAMSYQGAGDAAIHQTQISVSAALLSRGEPVEAVISGLMEATRAAAGEYGERWNWVREERSVRRMCEDWLRKNPRPEGAHKAVSEERLVASGSRSATVHKLEDHRKPKLRKPSDKAPPPHVVLAAAMIEGLAAEGRPFLSVAEASGDRQLWRYADGLWSMAVSIDVEIEVAARALGIPTSIKLRSETLAAIKTDPAIVRRRAEFVWDGHGAIPARNGLVDPVTLSVSPYTPEHLATWRLPHRFVPDASCPTWLAALRAFFRDKIEDEAVAFMELLQDAAGAGFLAVKPRALSRALVLYGPHNAGKSQILNVMTGLYGRAPIAQSLVSLEGEHGTVPFVRHAPWVLHEAFNQGRWVLSDKIKQLITGEPIQVNIKRGLQFEHVFRGPIFWATNHAPQIRDASRAVLSRMLVVPCNGGFDDTNPVGVAAEAAAKGYASVSEYVLDTEAEGVLRWAVEGLRRAQKRLRFMLPCAMSAIDQDLHDEANPIAQFVREFCMFDPDRMVRVTDFIAAYCVWYVEQRGDGVRPPSSVAIGRMVSALGDARIGTDKETFRTKADRFYGGLVLTLPGADYWSAAKGSDAARGRDVNLSDSVRGVNQDIPGSWDDREAIRKMRQAHGPAPPGMTVDMTGDDRRGDDARLPVTESARTPQF